MERDVALFDIAKYATIGPALATAFAFASPAAAQSGSLFQINQKLDEVLANQTASDVEIDALAVAVNGLQTSVDGLQSSLVGIDEGLNALSEAVTELTEEDGGQAVSFSRRFNGDTESDVYLVPEDQILLVDFVSVGVIVPFGTTAVTVGVEGDQAGSVFTDLQTFLGDLNIRTVDGTTRAVGGFDVSLALRGQVTGIILPAPSTATGTGTLVIHGRLIDAP